MFCLHKGLLECWKAVQGVELLLSVQTCPVYRRMSTVLGPCWIDAHCTPALIVMIKNAPKVPKWTLRLGFSFLESSSVFLKKETALHFSLPNTAQH